MGSNPSKLCKLEKQERVENAELIAYITRKSKHECKKCQRTAAKKKNLCKPVDPEEDSQKKKKKKKKKKKGKGKKAKD